MMVPGVRTLVCVCACPGCPLAPPAACSVVTSSRLLLCGPLLTDVLRRSCEEYVEWARTESQRLADLAGSRRDVGGAEYARRARELRDRLQGCLACVPLFAFYGSSRCVCVCAQLLFGVPNTHTHTHTLGARVLRVPLVFCDTLWCCAGGPALLPSDTVDLHGLTVAASLAVVRAIVSTPAGWGGRSEVVVITGKGVHSTDGPRLLPAVRDLLSSLPSHCAFEPFGGAGFRVRPVGRVKRS